MAQYGLEVGDQTAAALGTGSADVAALQAAVAALAGQVAALSGAILKNGSVNFDNGVTQSWPSAGTDISTVSSIQIKTTDTIEETYISKGNLKTRLIDDTSICIVNSSGTIIQKTAATGQHEYTIGGIKAGVVAPDAANYLEVLIDGNPVKIIIAA